MIEQKKFIEITPTGAYYAISAKGESEIRQLLHYFLKVPVTPQITEHTLQKFSKEMPIKSALTAIDEAVEKKFIKLSQNESTISKESLENVLPELFRQLVDDGKALLADEQGFCLSYIGFDEQASEQMAALSADISIIQERYEGVNQIGNIWGMVSPIDKKQISFLPIFIGDHRFVLVLAQKTTLNNRAFTQIIHILSNRYA